MPDPGHPPRPADAADPADALGGPAAGPPDGSRPAQAAAPAEGRPRRAGTTPVGEAVPWTALRFALAVSGWLALVLTLLPGGFVVRTVPAFVFVLVCPGAALMRLWAVTAGARVTAGRSEDDLIELGAASVGASFTVGSLVCAVFFLTGTFSMAATLATLAVLTSVAALWPGRTPPPEGS